MNVEEVKALIGEIIAEPRESAWVEFDEALLSIEDIGKRLSALANGACLSGKPYGCLVFGIDEQDHHVVGTSYQPKAAKANGHEELQGWFCTQLSPVVDLRIYELEVDDKHVAVFVISAACGQPVSFQQEAYIRVDNRTGKLVDYPEQARRIWHSIALDWSATTCSATLADLDPQAVARARRLYSRRYSHLACQISSWDDQTFLDKARLTINNRITYTALILLGLPESVHYLSPAEARITWILEGVDGAKKDYRHFEPPFLLAVDQVYQQVRNLKYRYIVDGTLFPAEIEQYDPFIIREALNNAIAHQDYRQGGRITLIEREDSTLSFCNYGDFIPQTVEKALHHSVPEQHYRNPFLAAAMINLNLIDTIGSGIKTMFEIQKERFFPLPDYELEAGRVVVTFSGKVLNMDYARKLAQMPELSLAEAIVLDKLQKQMPISEDEAALVQKKGLITGEKPDYRLA